MNNRSKLLCSRHQSGGIKRSWCLSVKRPSVRLSVPCPFLAHKTVRFRATVTTDTVKWRHSNLWSRQDLHVVGMMTYFAKLTGEDLSRYLNAIKLFGL